MGLFVSASGCQTLASHFSVRLCDNHFCENHPNQHECKIRPIVTMGGICRFLNPKPCRPLDLPMYISLVISRFSWQLVLGAFVFQRSSKTWLTCFPSIIYCHKYLRPWDEGAHGMKGVAWKKDESIPNPWREKLWLNGGKWNQPKVEKVV